MTAFLVSLFFVVLAEMGDKTQLATISLAIEYRNMLGINGDNYRYGDC